MPVAQTSKKMSRMKMAIILVIIASLVVGAWAVYRSIRTATSNAYYLEWVADMVVEHMDQNDGRCPTSFEDLRDDYERLVLLVRGRPWSFEELREAVDVDWHADPRELQYAMHKVIWLRNGSDVSWAGQEPNEKVHRYLTWRQEASSRPAGSYHDRRNPTLSPR